jgi:Fe-S oxidoreductase
LPEKAETVFFAGCGYQFSRQLEMLMSLIRRMDRSVIGTELPIRFASFQKKFKLDLPGIFSGVMSRGAEAEAEPLKAAVRVLRNLGIEPGYLADDEPCCGAPLYASGLHQEFASNAQNTHETLKSLGVRRLIGMVPSCTYALRELFPRYVNGYDLEVKHFVEIAAELVPPRGLRFPRKVKVTYHDPCQLGRYLGLIDEPRRVLNSIEGIELVETDWTKGEWSTCCGGGGGFEAVFPELSRILAANRAQELLDTGAEIIVTHCPGCIMQLKDGLKDHQADDVKVLDLAEIIAMAMEK